MKSKTSTPNNSVYSFNRYMSVIYFEFLSVRFTSMFYDDFGLTLFYCCIYMVHYSNPKRKLTGGCDHYEHYDPWAGFSSYI